MATTAQAYLLLLLDEESGKPLIASSALKYGLAGAVLADLAIAGRIELAEAPAASRPGTLTVIDDEPVGEPVCDTTLRELAADKPRTPHAVLSALARDIRPRVVDQLVDVGIVRREEGGLLGVNPKEGWPATATTLEHDSREGVRQVLVAGDEPTAQQAALIAMLDATDGLGKAFPRENRHEITARAGQIVASDWQPAAACRVVAASVSSIRTVQTAALDAGR